MSHLSPVSGPAAEAVPTTHVVEPMLSLQELAAELRVSCQTLYDLRSQGRGPNGIRVGRNLRFRRSEIEAWLLRLEEEDADRHARSAR